MEWIDLRSDTVTQPTAAMRRAMADAEVGDDVYGEDPTINNLEALAAERMAMEAGLFVPSGTMGNLLAVLTHCGRGDEMILGDRSHTFLYEVGGAAGLAGVHSHTLRNQEDGTLLLEDIENAVRADDVHYPSTQLLILENTHNACGGVPLSAEYCRDAARLAHSHGMKVHLDGARIFNAAAALDCSVGDLTAGADSITFCLSKGLAAPVGSVLCGSADFIQRARKNRKMLGGGMRQAGVLAAAGIEALGSMTGRLGLDHERTARLGEELASVPGLSLHQGKPRTNMLFIRLENPGVDTALVIAEGARRKIKLGARSASDMRLVVHCQIDDDGIQRVVDLFQSLLRQ